MKSLAIPDGEASAQYLVEELFRYFLGGFTSHATEDGTGARFKGPPGLNGKKIDTMEGFTRLAPLFAAGLQYWQSNEIDDCMGRSYSLAEILCTGISNGTDPSCDGYWGACGAFDQRVCESADVALALWISKEKVWERLTPSARNRVAIWCTDAFSQEVRPNNWLLFQVLGAVVLKNLTGAEISPRILEKFNLFKAFSQCLPILCGRVSSPCSIRNEFIGAGQPPRSRKIRFRSWDRYANCPVVSESFLISSNIPFLQS